MPLVNEPEFHRMELRLDFPDGQMWHCPKCERSLEIDGSGNVRVLFAGNTRVGHVRDDRDAARARRLASRIEQEPIPMDRRPDDMVDRGEHSDAESWGFGGTADVEWLKRSGIAW